MAAKRYPLQKRFSVALSRKAYKNLRALNRKHAYGNNDLLTIRLENFNRVVNRTGFERAIRTFKSAFGALERSAAKK